MNIRTNMLWRVPVYCAAASWAAFYLTVFLGRFFFMVITIGEDGGSQLSVDPVRSAVFNGVLFAAVLLIGGLWAFRSMTKAEIAVSAGIISAVYLLIALAQLSFASFPTSISAVLAYIQTWTGILSSLLMKATNNIYAAAILSSFAPMLFVPFGKRLNT